MSDRISTSSAAYAGAPPIALFGIEGDVGMAMNLLVVFLVAIWFALVFWTYADSRRRLQDPVLIGSATIAALIFPFAGALVYAIVRPPETLDDAYERELDVRAAELRVRMLESAVRGGPGSSAQSAALSGEMSGEPTARRSTPPPSGGTTRREGSGTRKAPAAPSAQPASAKPSSAKPSSAQPASARRSAPRAAESSAKRSAQPATRRSTPESSGKPTRRPPATGSDGA